MLNRLKLKKDICQDRHDWEKTERKLEDGFTYFYYVCKNCHRTIYTGPQLKKIQIYSKNHLFFTVENWVLLLLYVNNQYIAGITHYMKMLFLIFYEFVAKYKIPSENPGFYSYKYGPYSDRIDSAIEFLIECGYIKIEGKPKSSSKERFYITTKGKNKGKQLCGKLSFQQKKALKEFRKRWDQKTTKAISKYVYANYPEFTDKSIILNDLFPGRLLNRRRG